MQSLMNIVGHVRVVALLERIVPFQRLLITRVGPLLACIEGFFCCSILNVLLRYHTPVWKTGIARRSLLRFVCMVVHVDG